MSNHVGNDGVVKIGANAVAEIRGWSLDEQIGTIDDTVMNDTSETHKTIQKSWSASADAFWDETDTNGQGAIPIGASVTLNLYPEGAGSGAAYATGTATVTGRRVNGTHNGMVEASFEFKGNGALSWTTVGA